MNSPPSPLTLTLLRHGCSRADDEGVHKGRLQQPADCGRRGAGCEVGGVLAHEPAGVGCVVRSSLGRARRTAEIIGEALGLTVTLDDAWREFDDGPLAGLAFDEAERRYPEPAFRHRFASYTADGGEAAETARRIGGRSRPSCRVRSAGCSW